MIERQEIYCHECQNYVQFDIDVELEGNHILNCPNCGHEHCRVVEKGKITDVRWGQRNNTLPTYQVNTYSVTSSATCYSTGYVDMGTTCGTTGSSIMYSAWANTTTAA